MRDKIADIIHNADEKCRHNSDCQECKSFGLGSRCIDYLVADELIANGVILPPCRCKDCVYLRESDKTNRMFCTYQGEDYEVETFPNHYCSQGVGMVKAV